MVWMFCQSVFKKYERSLAQKQKALQTESAWRAAPSFLALFISLWIVIPVSRENPFIRQAGLLTPPPFQQPSHSDGSEQWRKTTEKVPFPIHAGKGEVTAAGPLPNLTGFPIKPDWHLSALVKDTSRSVKQLLVILIWFRFFQNSGVQASALSS